MFDSGHGAGVERTMSIERKIRRKLSWRKEAMMKQTRLSSVEDIYMKAGDGS
jgi:hypothetical protein